MLQPEHLFYGTALMALFSVQNYPIYISFTAKIAPFVKKIVSNILCTNTHLKQCEILQQEHFLIKHPFWSY